MKNYSQYDEQKFILEAFGWSADGLCYSKEKRSLSHLFLDIGAWHPTIFSNTRALIELGWRGVIVEPSPGPFINLMRACMDCGSVPAEVHVEVDGRMPIPPERCECGGWRYGFVEDLTLIMAGVGRETGLIPMKATHDALSTSNEAEYDKWKSVGGFYGAYYCPIITLEQIAMQFGGFDMINIDAEGVSCDLFMHALKLGWRPRVWCVELDRGREHEVGLAATNAGYASHVTTGNLVLVKQ
jgi:hypothetical protein